MISRLPPGGHGAYSASPAVDPQGPSSGNSRTSRGGAWSDYMFDGRCAARFALPPDSASESRGFRLAH